MVRCKAGEIPRSEAYFMYAATTRVEPNAADVRDGRLSTASKRRVTWQMKASM